MENDKIVLSDDVVSLLLPQAVSQKVEIVVQTQERSSFVVNSNQGVEESVITDGSGSNILGEHDLSIVDKLKKRNNELEKEVMSLKAAIYPLLEAFLKNEKLVEGMGKVPATDKHSVEFMTDMLYNVSKLLENLEFVEKTMRTLQAMLSKSCKGNIELIILRKQICSKLQQLSQSVVLEDVLAQLRSVLREVGINPGPLFKTKNDNNIVVNDNFGSKFEDLLQLDSDPIDIDYVLYRTEIDSVHPTQTAEMSALSGNVREDGTFDDSDIEFADHEEDYGEDGVQTEAETGVDLNEKSYAGETTKRYGLRKHRRGVNMKMLTERCKITCFTGNECNLCGKVFERLSKLWEHQRLHTGEKPYKCDKCGETFRLLTYLNDHKRIHTGEKPYTCEICGKCCRTAGDIWRHKKLHNKQHCCPYCSKMFQLKKQLVIHMRTHTGERPFVCSVCGQNFTAKASLRTHMHNIHHMNLMGEKIGPKEKKNANCPVCNKVVRLHGLKEHLAIHSDIKPYQCEVCGKGFTQSSTLTSHIQHMHSEVRNFHCNVCDKAFVRQLELNTHMQRHDPNFHEEMTCTICKKVLYNKYSLQDHMRVHSKEKKINCDHCDEMFYTIRSMREHNKRVHEGRMYQCDVCGKDLTSVSGLKDHKRIHTGEKPYVCRECGTCFRKKNALTAHKARYEKRGTNCGEKRANKHSFSDHGQNCDYDAFETGTEESSSSLFNQLDHSA